MKQIATYLTANSAIKALFLCLIFSVFSSVQSLVPPLTETSNIQRFIGTWVNTDSNTRGITKVIISKIRGIPKIQVFGACTPRDCNWGVRSAKAYTIGPSSSPASSMQVTYKPSFAVKKLNLQLTSGLRISYYTQFTDGSGRKNFVSEANFKKLLTRIAPNQHTAVKQISSTTQLTPAQIRAKRLAEWYRAHPEQRPNKKKVVKPRPQPKPQKSINQRLPTQCGFGHLYYGKVEYHKANKAYFLTIKDDREYFELDQFTSPKLLNKYIVLYGSRLVGGRPKPDFNGSIRGKVLQVVNNHQVDFNKLKAWCAKRPNSF